MRQPATVKSAFQSQKSFVERRGDLVWDELCETFPTGVRLTISAAAAQLPILKGYTPRVRRDYLASVLKTVYAQYEENPKAFPYPPFVKPGKKIGSFILNKRREKVMGTLDILKSILTEAECSEGLEDIADEIERLMREEGMRQVALALSMYIRKQVG